MNGRNRNLAWIGAIALAGIVSLLSCSSSDPTSPDVIGTPGGGIPGSSPSITAVQPDLTCANSGNTITIYGSDFPTNPLPTVTINGVAATVLSVGTGTFEGRTFDAITVSSGSDPATIPPGGLLVTVTVSTGVGTTSLGNALLLLPGCTAAPGIASINPSQAPRTGGVAVTIRGVGLACATSVSFSGTQTSGLVLDARIIEVIDDRTIVVSSPVNVIPTSETFDVAVTSDCGTFVLENAFTFTGDGGSGELVPNATAILPPEGEASGGNEVRILGSDLNLVDSIAIGSIVLGPDDFEFLAGGELLIPRMPPSPVDPSITVQVNVTVSAGGVADSSPVVYTYLGGGAAECGTLAPASGTQLGGTVVIITAALGSELTGIDGVTFGGVAGSGLVHPGSGQLVVTAPAYPAAIDVEVVLTVGGIPVATCPLNFTYTPSDPSASFSVDSIFPDQGPQSGDTQIQIQGSGLTAVTSILICDVPAVIQATAQELVTAVTGRFDGTTPAVCDVVVQAGSLGATLPAAFTYTPVVPDGQFFIDGATTSPEAGGMNFRIRGTELIGVTDVSFSGSQGPSGQGLACEVQVQSNTEVTGIVPRYFTPGGPFPAEVGVFVQSAGGNDPDTAVALSTGRRFRYYANPRLLSASGPGGNDLVGARQEVTVTGLNFIPENDIFVGSLEISNSGVLDGRTPGEETLSLPFEIGDNNSLTFRFPAARVQDFYDITIRTPLSGLSCTDDYSFTLLRQIFFGTAPEAATIDPPTGPFSGGTTATILGDFGTEVESVTIGGSPPQPIIERTSTSVTIVTLGVPEASAGVALDVVLTGQGGSSLPLRGAFTYVAQPDVVSAATTTINCPGLVSPPDVLPVTQGQVITVSGADLNGVTSATVGGETATVFPIDDNTIEIAIPPAPGAGGPIFDVVVSATFKVPNAGGQEDPPLSAILLRAVRYQDPPTVTGIEPASADPGSFVSITGTNLLNADGRDTDVFFAGTLVLSQDVSVSPDGLQILVRVPPGPEGQSVQVQVVTCQGSAFSPVAFKYPCNPPIVNSLNPPAGAAGTVVTLAGSSLISADGTVTSVTFDGQAALIDFVNSTPTNLIVTAPPGEAGVRAVVNLTTCGGEGVLAGFFTYGCGDPQITGITPAQGRAGTVVVISGSNLDSPDGTAVTVLFGANAASVNVNGSTSTELIVTAPAGVGAVTVTVTNCGSFTTFSAPPFTYCNTPTANLGAPTGAIGDVVVITGTSLLNPDLTRPIVTFGGVPGVVLESPIPTNTSISVQVPTNTGNQVVQVETCGGLVTAGSFQYCLRPTVTGFSPDAAPVGALVTILGTELTGADGMVATVTFDGIPAPLVDDSPLIVRAPATAGGGTATVVVTTCGGSSTALFNYCDAPAIADVNVGGGLPQGPVGTAVSIVGTNFIGGDGFFSTVYFGTQEATIIDDSDMNLLVTAPAGIANGTTVTVRVTSCGGTAASVAGDHFTYMDLPACPIPPSAATITIPAGASGPAGTQVTIEGTEIIGADGSPGTVLFGAFPATLLTSAPNVPATGRDTLVVIAPDGGFADLTNVRVTIVTCGGSFNVVSGFTYLDVTGDCVGGAAPSALGLSPASGGTGTTVTIEGADLFGPDGLAGVVRFGPFTASVVTAVEDLPTTGTDTIVVTAPAGFLDGDTPDVTVENCVGLSAGVTFTYTGTDICPGGAVPTALVLSPASGGTGTTVTIEGANLFGPNGEPGVVRFGPFTASVVTAVQDLPTTGTDTIVVTAPAGFLDGDTPDVTVENCVGLSAGVTFTYTGTDPCPGASAPSALVLSPASGGVGTTVTIEGADLIGPDGVAGTVRFGPFTATQVTAVEDLPVAGTDTIVVTAPAGFIDGDAPDVTVENCVGLSAGVTFTYTGTDICPGGAVPTALVLSPASGGTGTTVTIEGADLFGPNGEPGVVRFGPFTATQVTAVQDLPTAGTDTIVVTAPAGFADGDTPDVTVENCVGLSAGVTFTYTGDDICPGGSVPTAVTLSPASGGTGTPVTIEGADLFGPDGFAGVVRFGPFTATQVTAVQDLPTAGTDTIVVTAPAGFLDGDTPDVTVENCVGLSAGVTFTYTGTDACPGPATPTIASLSPTSGPVGEQVTVTGTDLIGPNGVVGVVRFGAFTASMVTFTEDVPFGTDTIVVTAPDGGFADGTPVGVTVTTCIGASAPMTYTYTDDCLTPAFDAPAVPPAFGPVDPESGPAGTLVTLRGMNFAGADGADPVVQFGTRVATLVDVTGGVVIVEAPAGIPNGIPVTVRLTNCGGTATAGETFTYSDVASCVGAAPGVASLSSTSGAAGDPIQITGTDLIGPDGNVSEARFGTFVATVIDFFDDPLMLADTMLVIVPGGPPVGATVTVSVENCAGTDQSTTFLYELPAVCVTNVTPAPGPAPMPVAPTTGTALEIVTISGTGLVGDDGAISQVFFGVQAATVLDQTSTQLLVRAPSGVPSGETVNVTVSHCGDTAVVGQFTYDTVFDVQSIAPNSGPRTGGQTVLIFGTGLAQVDTVTICGVNAVVDSATNSVVTITTGEYFGPAPATCDIVAADTVGPQTDSDTLPAAYTYTPLLPDGDSFDDAPGDVNGPVETAPASGGTPFRIRGTDLLDTSDVTFGGLVNDPRACDLQAQNDSGTGDDLVTGTVPAYRTPLGPFPADVQVFPESAAGRDLDPVTREPAGAGGLFTYYGNPEIFTAEGSCGVGCVDSRGETVTVTGGNLQPEFWSHVARGATVTLLTDPPDECGGAPTEYAVEIGAVDDTTILFDMPNGCNVSGGSQWSLTISTPNAGSTCTGDYTDDLVFSVFEAGPESVVFGNCNDGIDNDSDGETDLDDDDCELDCADGIDNDGDLDTDCADADCDGRGGCGDESLASGNCGDGIDNDADGETDADDDDCEDCTNGLDDDGDTFVDCATGNEDAECDCGPESRGDGNCGDGVDNDGDGETDGDDDDCESSCNDGVDNDGDGDMDCADADCAGEAICGPESTVAGNCTDGFDNDADGMTDAADPNCGVESQVRGNCGDGIDNDGDGFFDCAGAGDPDCPCLAESLANANCNDGVDNDGDGFADGADFDCEDCTNGVDDDGDTFVDCAAGNEDAECDCGPESVAAGNCADGVDNDGDGFADGADFDCELNCANGLDDDGDTFVDCADLDCDGETCGAGLTCIGGACV